MKSLFGLLVSLLADVRRLHPEVQGLDRDLLTIEARVKDEGIGFLTVALPALGKRLDLSLAEGRMTTTPGFSRRGAIPELFRGMFCHIFHSKTGLLLQDARPDLIKSMRQVLYLCKKLQPVGDQASNLDRLTQEEFFALDCTCLEEFPPSVGFFEHVAQYVLPNLDRFDFLKGRHGPGAVMEKVSANQKWQALAQGLSDLDPRLCMIGYDLPASLIGQPLSAPSPDDSHALKARLVTVPKSFSKLRTITVEPCLNQFVQQALGDHLRSSIDCDPILGLSLALRSQECNQKLALEGSQTGDWCTLDLSSASDLLSLRLVEIAFRRRPRFLEALLKSRTPIVTSPFGEAPMKKFAGMGNACTFPVQSVIFAILAICGSVRQDKLPDFRACVRAARDVRVYGDDIIVRREHFPHVANWITSYGLKINREKTFSEGNFRESCGWDCWMGSKVTPIYLRHDPECTVKDPSSFASLVSTSNQLWLECYYEASTYLRSRLDKGFPLPLVNGNCEGLGWHTRQDVMTFQRWNRHLHRYEVRTYVPTPLRRKDVLDGLPALLKFYHLPRISELDGEHLESSPHKFRLKLVKRWVQ